LINKYWSDAVEDLDQYDSGNQYGRTRTEHKNKLIICSLLFILKTYLLFFKQGNMSIKEVSWTRLYCELAIKLHVQKQHVVELCQQLMQDDDILVFGKG
jgi:hypothetical protein